MLLPTLSPVTGPVSPVAQQWGGFPWGPIHVHGDCPWGHGGSFAGGTASTGLSFRVWIIWGAPGKRHLWSGVPLGERLLSGWKEPEPEMWARVDLEGVRGLRRRGWVPHAGPPVRGKEG